MGKPMVSKIFIGSLIAIVAGVFVVAFGFLIALSTGTLVMEGPDVTGFTLSSTAPAAFSLALLGILGIVAGGIGQFIAWIGALVNTSRLQDKTWFVVLLVLGLLSFRLRPDRAGLRHGRPRRHRGTTGGWCPPDRGPHHGLGAIRSPIGGTIHRRTVPEKVDLGPFARSPVQATCSPHRPRSKEAR